MNKKLVTAMAVVAAIGTVVFLRKKKRVPAKTEPAGVRRAQKHRTESTSRAKNNGGAPGSELDII